MNYNIQSLQTDKINNNNIETNKEYDDFREELREKDDDNRDYNIPKKSPDNQDLQEHFQLIYDSLQTQQEDNNICNSIIEPKKKSNPMYNHIKSKF